MEVPAEKKISSVVFAHWLHRTKYTCRVCHYELGFSMKVNDTPIVCNKGKMNGEYCASCHNGKTSFGPQDDLGADNCERCHNTNASLRWEDFQNLQTRLPKTKFGNQIDWTKALDEKMIEPKDSLSGKTQKLANINKNLTLSAEMVGISPSIFPHQTHEKWLDCSNCHPELFNIKKKTTESLRMANMIQGRSCGICHLRVAFPLDDCKRCHPGMRLF
ncbi:MAG TPA: c(7)-type cytochrome triheme domain-containing protein [Dissulfurispiraceae bacterium]|nr:c(7)-type cytochrome triheme domain-containing protein [Dissulfurispiraceae bacterium]